MKVTGLDQRQYTLKLNDRIPSASHTAHKSSLHLNARALLKELFPLEILYEEVSLPGSGGLAADFIILTRKLLVEVHGEQHYKHIPYFCPTVFDFIELRKRDKKKIEWANINGFKLIELPYNESREQWHARISSSD